MTPASTHSNYQLISKRPSKPVQGYVAQELIPAKPDALASLKQAVQAGNV